MTGRVVRNARSLFPNAGPQEILQVKLKLVPVPTALQSEYAAGMEKYRDVSNFTSQGFDPAAWNAFLQTRQNFAPSPMPPQVPPTPQQAPPQQNQAMLYAPRPSSQHPPEPPQFIFQASNGAPPPATSTKSRPASPRGRRGSNASRPSSRASTRGTKAQQKPAAPALQRTESSLSQIAVPTSEIGDDGMTRKRACIQQADWRGPSAFDSSNEPLRVAASAAASIRGNRPSISGHPTAADIAAAEPGPRPPTPVPSFSRLPRNESSSNEAKAQRSRWYRSPYAMSADANDGGGSEAVSPEDVGVSAGSTPADIPSSPPIIHKASIAPTSPQLPPLADHPDSGFVSGAFDDFNMDCDGNFNDTMPAPSKPEHAAGPGLTSDLPGMNESISNQADKPKPAPRMSVQQQRAGSMPGSSPCLPPLIPSHVEATSPAPMMLDTDAAARSEAPPFARRPPLQHSESMPIDLEAIGRAGLKSGSGAKRIKSIETRRNDDLAAGKMPPYCKNCGEIDTPTWRKCFVKTIKGNPEGTNVGEGDDGFICWEATETDFMGAATAYRIIKKNVNFHDQGFEQLQLCNSCGIWLFKTKAMRPPERWVKNTGKDKNGKPVRKRPSRAKTGSAPPEGSAEGPRLPADEMALWSALTTDGPGGDSNEWALTDVSGRTDKSVPKSIGKRPRQMSDGGFVAMNVQQPTFLNGPGAAAALQRAIQSSPPRFPGSKTQPIDLSIAESPSRQQNVRRLLFPSPRKDGEAKTLDGSPSTGTPTKSNGATVIHMKDPFADTAADQENPNELLVTPTKKKSRLDAVKTPTRSSPRLAAKNQANRAAEFLEPPHDKPETPSRAAAEHIVLPEMTPFTASLNRMMSDGIGAYGGEDPSGMFNFSDFSNIDDFGLDTMGLPQSDGDWFPIHDEKDMNVELWNGGPLLEGELDELLRDAGDDAFSALDQQIGGSAPGTGTGTGPGAMTDDGQTPMSNTGTGGFPG